MTLTNTNSTTKLPLGWRWVHLGDITQISTGGTPSTSHPEYYSGDIRWLTSGDVKGTYIYDVPNRITQLGLDNSNARIHPPGSVMLAMSGQGKTRGTSAILMVPSACSQSVAAILPTPEALPEIIHFFLVRRYQDTRRITGDNERTGLNLKLIRKIEIPLPPLTEQERIARILNEQMAAVEKARSAAEARLEAAKASFNAYLRQVFESEAAKVWPVTRISEVCSQIDYGHTASADFSISEPKFLRITDIQNGNVNWDIVPGCKIDQSEEMTTRLLDGDIVFARTGGTVGKSFLIKDPPRAVFASYLIRLHPEIESIKSEYLYSFLQSDGYWRQLRMASRGGAQPNVNATLLGNLELPVPSIGEQEAILMSLREQMDNVAKLTEIIQQEHEAIIALPGSLLKRAFTGGL